MLRIGCHVSGERSETLPATVDIFVKHGFKRLIMQMFDRGPKGYGKVGNDNDNKKIFSECRNRGADVWFVFHGAYVDNGWIQPGATHNIIQELRSAREVGAIGVIVHTDKNVREGVGKLVKHAPMLVGMTLYLEVNPNIADPDYGQPIEIRGLIDWFNSECDKMHGRAKRLVLGYCIDTAHLFSKGIRISTSIEADNWIKLAKKHLVGVPQLLHFNDCETPFGSGRDQHAPLGEGNIWSGLSPSNSGIGEFLQYAAENNIPVILETRPEYLERQLLLIQGLQN